MKKQILAIAIGLVTMFSVSTSFAATAKSTEATKGSIVVKGDKTTAFDVKGNWVYTIHRYSSDNLPKNVFDVVRGDYSNYYVNGMEKIEQPGSAAVYLVYLENNNSYKTVRVNADNETELVQNFVKG